MDWSLLLTDGEEEYRAISPSHLVLMCDGLLNVSENATIAILSEPN